MAKTIKITNNSASTVICAGISVPANQTVDLITAGASVDDLRADSTICKRQDTGDLVVNDGTSNMADAAASFQLIALLCRGV